jgi:hypothetical protein
MLAWALHEREWSWVSPRAPDALRGAQAREWGYSAAACVNHIAADQRELFGKGLAPRENNGARESAKPERERERERIILLKSARQKNIQRRSLRCLLMATSRAKIARMYAEWAKSLLCESFHFCALNERYFCAMLMRRALTWCEKLLGSPCKVRIFAGNVSLSEIMFICLGACQHILHEKRTTAKAKFQ